MNRRERILALIVATLVGLFVLDQLVIQPVSTHLSDLSDRAEAMQDRLRQARVLMDNRELIKSRWQSYRAAGLEAAESAQRLRVQRSLNQWAAEAGVEIDSLTTGRSAAIHQNRFFETRFILRGNGGLEAVVGFLHRLRRSPFPLRVVAMDVGSRSESDERLSVQMTVSTIRLNPEAEDDAASDPEPTP